MRIPKLDKNDLNLKRCADRGIVCIDEKVEFPGISKSNFEMRKSQVLEEKLSFIWKNRKLQNFPKSRKNRVFWKQRVILEETTVNLTTYENAKGEFSEGPTKNPFRGKCSQNWYGFLCCWRRNRYISYRTGLKRKFDEWMKKFQKLETSIVV